MSVPRVGPWGAGARVGGAVARGEPGRSGRVVSCGSMKRVPPSRRPRAATVPPTFARVGPTGKRNVRGGEGKARRPGAPKHRPG